MIRAVIMITVMMMSAIMPASCHAQFYDEDDPGLRIFEGRVEAVDIGKSTLSVVYGEAKIVFPVTLDTRLVRDTRDIKLSDFGIGDYVNVEYLRSGSESRLPSKTTKINLVYDASK